jgi:hypothetical protein
LDRIDREYRGYRVIAAPLKGKPCAQIYAGKSRIGGIRFEGETLDEVYADACIWIDGRLGAQISQQRAPHIATSEQYLDFLNAEKLGDHERSMLTAHATARVLTAGQLAEAAGWPNYSSANVHYGFLGRKAAARLGLELPLKKDGTPVFTYALADSASEGGDPETGHFQWAIHPELATALVMAGLLNEPPGWLNENVMNLD